MNDDVTTYHSPAPTWFSLRRYLLLIVLVVVIDQLCKWWVTESLKLHEAIAVTPFFNIYLNQNTGVAFSQLQSLTGGRWLLSIFAILICVYLMWWMKSAWSQPILRMGLAFVVGGAIGNLLDRLRYGYVVDFFDFFWGTHHWPTFNMADSAITLGVGLLLWSLFKEKPAPSPADGTDSHGHELPPTS